MRNYQEEFDNRVEFIRQCLADAHAEGIVFGNSGGKDSALVGILCKAACSNTVGIIMPCASKRNFESDADDGEKLAKAFDIETRVIDLTPVREAEIAQLKTICEPSPAAISNIAPRLRMTTLYTIGQTENRLVAGTGNRSEIYMGYFTKWGDGGTDFNPIADLCATEVFEFLRFLGCPASIIEKAPSAGLFEGQTDESEMGISYADIDKYILTGEATEENLAILSRYHSRSEHKRNPVRTFK